MSIAWECPRGHWTLANEGFSRPGAHPPRHCERCYREWIRGAFPIGQESFDTNQRLEAAPNEIDVAHTAPPGRGDYWVDGGGGEETAIVVEEPK